MHTRGPPQYSFPILSTEEILQCLAELNIPFSEPQFKKPTFESVRLLLEQFVELLVGVGRDELIQPVFGAMDELQFPELHEDSIGILAFHRESQKLMEACGIFDFAWKDYTKPDFQRLRKILSGIINFAKFREERLVRFQELTLNSEALADQKQSLEDENRALEAQLRAYREKEQAEEPVINELKEETGALAKEIHELNQKQEGMQDRAKNLKGELGDINDRLSQLKFQLLGERQEIACLEALVVSSPDKVKREIEDLNDQLEMDKENILSIEKRNRELHLRAEGLEKCKQEILAIRKIMQECEKEMKTSVQLQANIKDQRAKCEEFDTENRKLESTESHLSRQLRNVEERLERIHKQKQERVHDTEAGCERLRIDRDAVLNESLQINKRVAQNDQTCAQTRARMDAITAEYKKEIEQYKQVYQNLTDKVLNYHKEVFSGMKKAEITTIQ